ncbi:MAG: peptide-methionine (S)-S-oxide reductase MsrA [Gemmatimonadales bacterium]
MTHRLPSHLLFAAIGGSMLALTAMSAPSAPRAHAPALRTMAVDTAVFAGGCFWGVEGVFEHVKGVISATSGYAGGSVASPSYEEVSSGTTGHAESVRVVFDPSRVRYADLLQVFFLVAHDPTELDRQGPDIGTQYRSLVLYRNAAQKEAAEAYVAELGRTKVYERPIVTRIEPLQAFYPAEAYHQHYMALHPDQPYIYYNDAPKLVQLRQRFPTWYRES